MNKHPGGGGGQLVLWLKPRRWRLFGAGFMLGLLGALGQPPFALYPIGLAGFVAGFLLIAAMDTPKRAAMAGWALGTGYFAGTLIWIVEPFMVDVARHGWMAPFALVFLAGGLALFWSLASGLAFWLTQGVRGGRFFWLAWAVAMGLAELIRGVIFTGFPWGGLASFWLDTPLIGLAGLVGASGMGALTFLLIAGAGTALHGPGKVLRLTALVVPVALLSALGLYTTSQELPERAQPITLRLIQPNASQHLKWHPDHVLGFLERAIDLTAAPPAQGASDPDLVIWPEASVPYLLERAGPVLAEIAAEAAPGRVVLGIQRSEDRRYFTSLVALDQNGAVEALYDKHHLVPFGEFIPGGALMYRLGLKGFAAQYGYGYSAGPGAAVLDLGTAGKVLPLICYEAIFPGNLRHAPERADWIVQITNDAWFGGYSGPQQHLAQARLRAAEFGLPLVRAANTGISAVIDARGGVVASLGLDQAGYLDAELPAALPATIYSRSGDLPLTFLFIGIGSGLWVQRRKNRV
ncbi:MAG: apolipoprotein N-acyltransferase [Rhodobacteraceae bacterium]|nr:apolipoprotein N-acyltransferase [Paracoccaceae bacterium]